MGVEPPSIQTTTPVVDTTPKGGCESYRPLLEKYDWDVKTMMAIMQAESGCDPTRVGDNYPINGLLAPSCGLMQIRTLEGRPSCEELKDSATNIAWAYKIYASGGLKPWSVYTNGTYLKFM